MPKFTQLTMPTLDDPTALQKINPELWLTQEVLKTGWVRLRDAPSVVVTYAAKRFGTWELYTLDSDSISTTCNNLRDLLMLHIDPDIVRVLKLKANNEVDLFKEFNPLWLWASFGRFHWVLTAANGGRQHRVVSIKPTKKGFSINPADGFNSLEVNKFTHLANHLTLNVPEPVLEIFSAKGQFPHLISNDFEV